MEEGRREPEGRDEGVGTERKPLMNETFAYMSVFNRLIHNSRI